MVLKLGMLIESMFRYMSEPWINLQVHQVQNSNMSVKSEFLAHMYSKQTVSKD
jgi:hypothetical protein